MGYDVDAAIAKAKKLKESSFGEAAGKIGGQAAGKVTKQSAPAIAQAKITQRYGTANPTAADVSKQAEAIAQWDTDMDVTTFLNQAVTDGVVTPSEAESIFSKTTGGSLFSQQNQQKMVSEYTRLKNGGTPVWRTQQVNRDFGDYTAEQAKAKLEELYIKEDMTPYDREAFSFLLGKTDSKTAKSFLDRAKKDSDTAYTDFEEYNGVKIYAPGFDGMPAITDDKPTDKKMAEKRYRDYEKYLNRYSQYNSIYEDLKYREDINPYIEEATSAQDFDSKKIYSGEAKSNIGLYINGGSVYDIETHPDEGTAMVESELEAYRHVTPEERDVYNYYENTNQPEKAYDFAQKLLPTLNKRSAMYAQEEFAELANEFPITANALSVGINLATAPSAGVEFISQMFTGEDFDPYAPGFRGAIASEAIRSQTAENIKNPVWKFVYNTGMSMVDSAAVMPMGGVGIAFLGTNAAVAEGRKTAIEGGSKVQIFAKGIAAGAFEATFEKIGLDNLFKPRAVGGFAKALQVTLAQGGIEASEELCTSIANNLIDDLMMGNESNYKKLVKEYLAKGMSLGEAQYQAMIDMGGEVLTDTLAGFVSGMAFGAGGSAINYTNAVNTGKQINAQGNKDTLIGFAKMQDSESTAYKDAVKLSDKKSVKNAEVGALLQQMIIDKQISEADAKTLVTKGLNGAPLDKAEQVYYYAGANGLSIQDTVELNSNLTVDPDRAIAAWQMGAELYEGRKADVQNAEAVKKNTERPKEIEKTKEAFAVQNGGNVVETPAVQNNGRAKSIVRENYNEAAEEFRTEENAELFDVAYNQGLLGEKLNLSVIVPDKDISAVSQAYVAGTRDARIISERRANFDNRTPGLFTDAVTEQLSKKIGSRTLNAIDALGKKLGVQIRFIQRGEAGRERYSYYSPSEGVIAININEIHGKLTGDKLIRFIANHEGIHRIRETSPKAYAEMEKLALSKSRQTVEDRMARFGESKERATEEIVADYFGEVLTSKAEIKTLLNKHRGVFDAIMEALEWLVDKMRGIANYSFSEIAEARKLFQEALAEANADVWGAEVRSDGDILWANSENGKRTFSYDELVAKGDIQGVVIKKNQQVKLTADGKVDIKELMEEIHKKCEKIETKSKEPTYYIEVPDIGRNVEIVRKAIEHGFIKNLGSKGTSLSPQDMLNARISLALPEILKNSIEVNRSFRDKSADVPYTHVMLGTIAMENEDGTVDYYAVRMMVEEKINRGAILTEANILGKLKAINAKNVGTPQNWDTENKTELPSSVMDTYTYNIAELLENVKTEFDDTFSVDVYQKLGMERYADNFSNNLLFSRSEDSEDNVKYFPPGEDPRRDIKVPSEVNGKKVRRFTRTAAESPALTPEMAEDVVSEIENGRFYYTPSSNKALADNAMNKVENDVIQAASEWKTAFDSGKMITDKDIAIGEALIIEAGKRGDTERAIELISEVGIAATEAGKVVQAIKLLKRMTPEGQVYYLSKVVERLNKERGKTKGKEFNKSIEAENKATEADKKYKQAEAKVKTAEEKLFDIETAIEEYTKDLDIEVKIAESVEKIADLKKKLSEAKGKVKSADASSEKLGDNIKEIEGQLEEERKKLKEAMAKRDANLKERAEKGIMLSKLKAGVKRVDNATDHILGEIDILEDDISKVEAEYDRAVEFRDECAKERRRLTAERNSLIKKTESADKASEKDLQKISQLEEEIAQLSDKYNAAKGAAERASLIRKELKAERNGLSYKLAKIENAIDYRETEIAKLKEEIAQLLNAEYEASKELEKAKEERTLKQKARDKAKELAKTAKAGANIIELPADIKKAILESKTEEELNESVELAKDYIAENMVATKAEKIRAWRYLSMLGNLRTQVRNIIGNGFMLLNVLSKNVVATPIETVAVYASHKNLEKQLAKMKADGATEAELKAYHDEHYAERTKTWTLFKKKSAELKSFVTESWESNIKLAKGQSGKNDNIIGDINDRRTIFKSEKPVLKQVAAGVEAWRKATNWAMERGDEVFLKINYKHALTSYILSNKWDVNTMTEAQKLRAEQYALKEAQEATFRDESALADLINKARNKGWGYELAIGGLMPFTKTPINITKRSIEYGPTGIVNAIAQGVKAAKGEATSSDVVNALAKTFSGSALAGLGFYLAAKGLLRSKGDEEDEEYNYLIGEQDYSLIIGDYRFSIEWAAPAAVPLLFGASIYNAWFEKDGGTKEEYMVDENGNIVLNTNSMATHKVMNAVSTMFAPIFEASYLSGLTDSVGAAFSFGSGDASEGLAIFGINAGLSYANQFIPTVFGQIARTIDPVERRNNDYDKTSILPYSVQRGIEKSKNKIPFLNRTSTPYVNAWGEEEIKQGALDYILSVAENFVLPGYIEKVTDDELTNELWRLENTEMAEEKKVFPESVKTSYTEDGKTIPLTAEQRNKRQKVAGQKGREYIEAFYNSDEYGKLTDAERVEAIDLLWGKANEEGIQAVRPDYASSDTNVERLNYAEKNIGISPEDYALWKIAYERANEDGNSSYNMDEVDAALDIFIELSGEEWTDEQLGYLWQQRSTALSNKNPYGYALKGTPWYKAKQADGQTWKNER